MFKKDWFLITSGEGSTCFLTFFFNLNSIFHTGSMPLLPAVIFVVACPTQPNDDFFIYMPNNCLSS